MNWTSTSDSCGEGMGRQGEAGSVPRFLLESRVAPFAKVEKIGRIWMSGRGGTPGLLDMLSLRTKWRCH